MLLVARSALLGFVGLGLGDGGARRPDRPPRGPAVDKDCAGLQIPARPSRICVAETHRTRHSTMVLKKDGRHGAPWRPSAFNYSTTLRKPFFVSDLMSLMVFSSRWAFQA